MKDSEVLIDIYNSAFYDNYLHYGHCPAYGCSKESMEKSLKEYHKIIAYENNKPIGVISYKTQGQGKYYIGCLVIKKKNKVVE